MAANGGSVKRSRAELEADEDVSAPIGNIDVDGVPLSSIANSRPAHSLFQPANH